MKKSLNVVAVQTRVPKNKDEGEAQILRLVKDSILQPVDMIGLPEDCIASFKDIEAGYQPLDFLASIAKENNIYLFGATLIKDSTGLHNRGFLFDRSGKLVLSHDKIVLTPPEQSDGLITGTSIEVVDTEFGKICLLVCKDSFHRYAAWFFAAIRKAGADIVLIPSYSLNVSDRSKKLWVDSLKALSKWFDVYIVAPGTIGPNATDYPSFGHALIICPNRDVLSEGSDDQEELLRAKLDAGPLEAIRKTYGSLWQPVEVPQFEVVSK